MKSSRKLSNDGLIDATNIVSSSNVLGLNLVSNSVAH